LNWVALASAFGLVFVAEIGDKTQLAVISQTCTCRRSWPVFLGASLALVVVTAIGVVGGEWLAARLPREWLGRASGAAFLLAGLWVARNAGGDTPASAEEVCEEDSQDARAGPGPGPNLESFRSTFGLLFLAEMGDKTQLAVLSLAAATEAPWAVFWGASLALTAVTAMGVLGGEALRRVIPERVLLRLSALAFVLRGLAMLAGLL
jgi:putative Ca2+/H+ antiporter (TMEM165/GDT1 family)